MLVTSTWSLGQWLPVLKIILGEDKSLSICICAEVNFKQVEERESMLAGWQPKIVKVVADR